jgi:hypothetical protein
LIKRKVVKLKKKIIGLYIIIFLSYNLLTSNSISLESVDNDIISTNKYCHTLNKNILPPYPPYIEGPTNCNVRGEYNYNFTISHPENIHLVSLIVIFGDGKNLTINYRGSSCHKGWRPGYTIMIRHKWQKSGDYSIKAKVKDYGGFWSDWGTLEISVIKQKDTNDFNHRILKLI